MLVPVCFLQKFSFSFSFDAILILFLEALQYCFRTTSNASDTTWTGKLYCINAAFPDSSLRNFSYYILNVYLSKIMKSKRS